jgi:antitoxin component of MazEF toxin-antitoxin module
MKEKFVKIIRKNGDSLAINLPVEVVGVLNLKEGEIVRVEIERVERK